MLLMIEGIDRVCVCTINMYRCQGLLCVYT
uniref:Uncharacterized protein n=1 Tax=Arundo donax TaxID=35708 RepID=A0A0A9EEV9_ARUDO